MNALGGEVRLVMVVRGRVQGVGFRYWVRAIATDLGLRGSATNLPDGRVEVVVEGTRAACEQLLAAVGSDRAPGWVGALSSQWSEAQAMTGFRVR